MLSLLSLLTCIVAAELVPQPTEYQIHGQRINSHAWTKQSKPEFERIIPIKIALAQQNLEKGAEWLDEVSNPASNSYGKHWTPEQVIEAFRPQNETYEAVHSWLTSSGINQNRIKTTVNHWITFNASIAEAQMLFKAEYHIFTHNRAGIEQIGSDNYSLPAHLFDHVELVTPTVHFDRPIRDTGKIKGPVTGPHISPAPKTPPVKVSPNTNTVSTGFGSAAIKSLVQNQMSSCYYSTVPACLRLLYSIPINYQSNANNSFAMVEYAPNNYNLSDLTTFNQVFSGRQVGSFPTLDSVDGGQLYQTSMDNEIEPSLDFEIANLAWPQNSILLQAGDDTEGASFNNLLDAIDASYCSFEGGDNPYYDAQYPDGGYSGAAMCGTYSPPAVLSTSYGYDEAELSPAYAARQCAEYMKLGLLGTSVLFSAGDYGVAGQEGYCPSTNNGIAPFRPSFPSTCPYVTSVGSTQVQGSTNIAETALTQPEMATSAFPSGGGFSNYFSIPSYQASAVANYLATTPPPYNASYYNNTGQARAYPDVAANGYDYITAVDGSFYYISGTSASSPTFASILTLINQARLNAGKSTVGFVNPALYSAGSGVMNDVTVGSNPGCGVAGFETGVGWDPVSGLGTTKWAGMVAYFSSLA